MLLFEKISRLNELWKELEQTLQGPAVIPRDDKALRTERHNGVICITVGTRSVRDMTAEEKIKWAGQVGPLVDAWIEKMQNLSAEADDAIEFLYDQIERVKRFKGLPSAPSTIAETRTKETE